MTAPRAGCELRTDRAKDIVQRRDIKRFSRGILAGSNKRADKGERRGNVLKPLRIAADQLARGETDAAIVEALRSR